MFGSHRVEKKTLLESFLKPLYLSKPQRYQDSQALLAEVKGRLSTE
jgi:hypothetical protein